MLMPSTQAMAHETLATMAWGDVLNGYAIQDSRSAIETCP